MRSRYIIFADDDADDLELITGFFKQYNRNVNVLEFKDGKEVLKFLDEFAQTASEPILIVLDINMPRMNGREALAAIRRHSRFQHIPVILYTTSSSKSDQEYCRQHHATWVNKPYNIDEVRHVAKIISEFCQIP